MRTAPPGMRAHCPTAPLAGRRAEVEADLIGLKLMALAGYEPRAAPNTFRLLARAEAAQAARALGPLGALGALVRLAGRPGVALDEPCIYILFSRGRRRSFLPCHATCQAGAWCTDARHAVAGRQ